jgi:uncharacterized membrane protein YqaE (UPF0057 family)
MCLALVVPGLAVIMRGKILTGLFLLFLQVTVLGWLPAALIAISIVNGQDIKKEIRKQQRNVNITYASPVSQAPAIQQETPAWQEALSDGWEIARKKFNELYVFIQERQGKQEVKEENKDNNPGE